MSDEEDSPVASLEARIEDAASAAEAADTEAALDEVAETLDAIESDLEDAELPEPDPDEADADEPSDRERLESAIEDVRTTIEASRGPYAEDIVESLESVIEDIGDADFTDEGAAAVPDHVAAFLETVDTELETDVDSAIGTDSELEAIIEALESVTDAIESANLDPDDDAETIATLLDSTDDLATAIDDAETWDDLTVREQLERRGFYDVLEHHKDYPPEWSAIKVHEQQGNTDMVLLALEKFDSSFMEEHCIDALRRMADPAALDAMMERAQKRDQDAIEVLGKIGSDEPVEMLLEYAENDGNPALQLVTLQALGEIGSETATQTVADRLVHEEARVRSQAARTLGLIGDTRAIEPLAETLAEDESDVVRGSAAWALNQIGTSQALEALEPFAEDRVYLVQVEAEKAAVQ